eukprot:Awhi_evm1s12500
MAKAWVEKTAQAGWSGWNGHNPHLFDSYDACAAKTSGSIYATRVAENWITFGPNEATHGWVDYKWFDWRFCSERQIYEAYKGADMNAPDTDTNCRIGKDGHFINVAAQSFTLVGCWYTPEFGTLCNYAGDFQTWSDRSGRIEGSGGEFYGNGCTTEPETCHWRETCGADGLCSAITIPNAVIGFQSVNLNTPDVGACRFDDINYKGVSGFDFDKVQVVDQSECEQRCSESSKCLGYETNGGSHCELWSRAPNIVTSSTGYACYIKITTAVTATTAATNTATTTSVVSPFSSSYPTTATISTTATTTAATITTPSNPVSGFQSVNPNTPDVGACRFGNIDYKGVSGLDYDKVNVVDQNECEKRCSESSKCLGYETNRGSHCELWSIKPDIGTSSTGYACYTKVTTTTTTETTTTTATTTIIASPPSSTYSYATTTTITTPVATTTPSTTTGTPDSVSEFQSVNLDTPDVGACRFGDINYKGVSGFDYDKVHVVDENECERLCSESLKCLGYETDRGSHCELWSKKPNIVTSSNRYACYAKATTATITPTTAATTSITTAATTATPPTTTTTATTTTTTTTPSTPATTPTPTTPAFSILEIGGRQGACRFNNGNRGTEGIDYIKVTEGVTDQLSCELVCLNNENCKGYETRGGHCENWLVLPDEISEGSYTCF